MDNVATPMVKELIEVLDAWAKGLDARGIVQCMVVACVTRDGQGTRLVKLFEGTTLGDASKLLVELEVQGHAIKTQLMESQERMEAPVSMVQGWDEGEVN